MDRRIDELWQLTEGMTPEEKIAFAIRITGLLFDRADRDAAPPAAADDPCGAVDAALEALLMRRMPSA